MLILVGSLFAGIGGLELGLCAAFAEAGIPHRVAWQVEMDPFCRSILARHWPDADRSVIDVRAAFSLPPVDLCCFGFPCQDVSSAGKGAGLDGDRSGLWFAGRDVLAALRPDVAVIENVASGKRRYLCRVRRDLRALGYRETAYQLGAHDVGAPHRRERIFVVAYRDGDGREGQRLGGVLNGKRTARGDHADGCDVPTMGNARGSRLPLGGVERGEQRPELAPAERASILGNAGSPGREGASGDRLHGAQLPQATPQRGGRLREAQPGVGGGPHGLPARMDIPTQWPAGRGAQQEAWEPPRTVTGRDPHRRARLRALGNAVVPAQAREIGRLIVASIGGAP